MRKRADSAADLSHRNCFARTQQSLAIAAHLVKPKRERQTKRSRLGVDAVRASDLRRVFELERATLQTSISASTFFSRMSAASRSSSAFAVSTTSDDVRP